MRSISYLMAVIALSFTTHASAEDLTTDAAVMSMSIPLYASISKLDDFSLTSTDSVNYSGSDNYSLLINGQVRVTATYTNLVNGSTSVTPTVSLDGGGTTFDTAVDSSHNNALHVLSASAVIRDPTTAGGNYVGTITLTVSSI